MYWVFLIWSPRLTNCMPKLDFITLWACITFQNRLCCSPDVTEKSWSRFCTSMVSTLARKVSAAMLAATLSCLTTSLYRASTSDSPQYSSATRSRKGRSRPVNRTSLEWCTFATVFPLASVME